MNSTELGFGFKSIKRFASRAYNVAALPAQAASRVARATASAMCRDGKSVSGDARTQAFCRAVKMKNEALARKYLPSAVQRAAQRAATTRQIYTAATAQPVSGFESADVNLLASLNGADPGDLAFALAGVTPGDLGAVPTRDLMAAAPFAIAVAAGVWMLVRG